MKVFGCSSFSISFLISLEQELEAAKFKAIYYSTLVRAAEQELGIDIEKKSATKQSDSYK